MPRNDRRDAPIEPLFSAPASNNEFVKRFVGMQRDLWLHRIDHSALYPNCTITVEQVGDAWYPLPRTLPSAFHDGTLRCDFTNVAAEVLEKCPWFWKEVVLHKIPYLADKEYREGCARLMDIEKKTEELKLDLQVFEPEVPELQAKSSSLTTELDVEKSETAKQCGEKESALKDANDVRESLIDQNEALKKEVESLKARLHSLQ